MSPLTFTFRESPVVGVDCAPLIPDAIAGKSPDAIAAIELACGNRRLHAGTLFEVAGDDTSRIVIRGGGQRLERVAAGMTSGSVTVDGDCGACAGAGMRGGRLVIAGDAGMFAASGLRGGSIEVRGNAGDFLGAAQAGDRHGMRGGSVVVHGNAGSRCGDRMRRGLIVVKGDCGDYCASRMLAGTIMVRGRVGAQPGFALRRGTVLLWSDPVLPPTFQESGEHALLLLALLEKYLAQAGEPLAGILPLPKRVRRFSGDLAFGGAGEILVAR